MAIKEYSDFGSVVSYEERMAAAIREIDTGYDAIRAGGNLSFSAGTIFRKAVEYIAFGQVEASGFTLADVHFWDSAKERKVFHKFSRPGYAQMVTFLSELHLVGEDELEYYEVFALLATKQLMLLLAMSARYPWGLFERQALLLTLSTRLQWVKTQLR